MYSLFFYFIYPKLNDLLNRNVHCFCMNCSQHVRNKCNRKISSFVGFETGFMFFVAVIQILGA